MKVRIQVKEVRHYDFEVEMTELEACQLNQDVKQGIFDDLALYTRDDGYEHVDYENGKIEVIKDEETEL